MLLRFSHDTPFDCCKLTSSKNIGANFIVLIKRHVDGWVSRIRDLIIRLVDDLESKNAKISSLVYDH